MSSSVKPTLYYISLDIVIALCICVLDMALPLGVADGVLYISLVLIGLLAHKKSLILGGAIAGTCLTAVGFFLSPPGGELWKVLINRILAVIAIWITAGLCLRQNRSQSKILLERAQLDDRVKERTSQLNEANLHLQRETKFVKLHKDIAVASNETSNIEDTMKRCLKIICNHAGWPVGHLYVTEDRWNSRLQPTGIWFLENPNTFESFRNISEETPFDPGTGLPGRVLQSGKPTWIIDVSRDPNFPRASLAENIGVRAGFAFPILIGKEVVAVMEFFSTEAAEPDGKMLEIMAQVGTQLGRVVERQRAEKDSRNVHDQLRNLYHRLELIREEERTRIAREVHDELAQILTTLKLELSITGKKLAKFSDEFQNDIQMMLELIDNTIRAVKKLVMDLRPPLLDDLGLSETINWQGKEFERRTGIEFNFTHESGRVLLDEGCSTTVFRIFQEALTNIARHAKAKKVDINLKDEKGFLILDITDNGIGITQDQISNVRSLGLLGMRERALAWGAQVQIRGATNTGTTVTIKIRNGQ